MIKYYEAIIIGGGPAGSAAAMYLSDAGFDVCLIEKKLFPRETLCGEFLSGEVFKHIKDLSIDRQFLSLSPNSIKSFKIFFENGKNISGEFDFNAFALKRSVFDSFLLENAKMKGAEILQPAEVQEIIKDKEKFILRIKHNDEELILKTEILVGAYGKQNELDNKLMRSFSSTKTGLNGIKFHISREYLNSFSDNEIHIYTGKDIYCGINCVSPETATLCFLQQRRESISYRDSLLRLFKENPSFMQKLKKKFFESPHKVYGTGNLFLGMRSKVENGIIMIGDAAGVISPFTGDGIGMALDSAKLAAGCLALRKDCGLKPDELSEIYEKSWNRLFSRRIRISKIIQNFLLKQSFKKFATHGLFLFNYFPFLNSYLLKATRV